MRPTNTPEDTSHESSNPSQHLAHIKSFPDVVVECGGTIWDLHKAVLTARSEWFRAALLGPFREARTGQISIQGHDDFMIQFLIDYIYTGDYDWRKLQGDLPLVEVYMDVFDLADYFLLPDLRELSEEAFTGMLLKTVPNTQAKYPINSDDTAELFEVVRQVYARENSPAARAFQQIVTIAMHSIVYETETNTVAGLIREIPAVGTDILEFLLTRQKVFRYCKERCVRCSGTSMFHRLLYSCLCREINTHRSNTP
ncbi:hypothetical protein O1611_g6093 [Lasiodiplodia mahajangana]|uniref:Uncharacterized protein n=1 Tax=Lasiodiplodia mahajangana TaxID=1108764 RepID=A0ACC2JJC1_9PEZI|nr:hypothetical protein O1611_g6093 [Lasiodiplodia mahajangana]